MRTVKKKFENVVIDRKIKEFEEEYISFLHSKHQATLDDLSKGKLTDEIKTTLEKVAADLSSKYAK